MNYKDYYQILGVPKDTAEKDVKSAYRKLARKWHPDVNPTNKKVAEEKFKDIQEAYEVLGDPAKRKKYDALGSNWQQAAHQAEQHRQYRTQQGDFNVNFGNGNAAGGPTGFSDFFEAFFSGIGKRGGATFSQRGQDLETTVDLSLREAHEGGRKVVTLQAEDACTRCNGTGTLRGTHICAQCHGTGRILTTKKFDVNVPKGVREGQRIRLAGQGGAGIGGGAPGDLYLVVRLVGDETYERKGDDLYVDLPVSIYDLVLGAEVKVPTMTGDVTMRIPPGTQNNKRLRLAGKGMPKVRDGGTGDQYVRLIGTLPSELTEKELKLFKELAALRNGKH